MIRGNGIDIIEIHRIKRVLDGKKNFLKKIFTENEIGYIVSRKENVATIAGLFAAKEAISKSIGHGIRGYKWTDIEIGHDCLGKPIVLLKGTAKEIAKDKEINIIHLSISHTKEYAVAFAIAEDSVL